MILASLVVSVKLKEARKRMLAGRKEETEGGEEEKRKPRGEKEEKKRIFQPEFLDVAMVRRLARTSGRRRTFNSRDVHFRRT